MLLYDSNPNIEKHGWLPDKNDRKTRLCMILSIILNHETLNVGFKKPSNTHRGGRRREELFKTVRQ
jgi:hypothetical protein